ncbi:MAG: hypothetical protein P8170_12525 [Gemmatimonadota bacterium]
MLTVLRSFWLKWWRSAAAVRERRNALDALTREPSQVPPGESEST